MAQHLDFGRKGEALAVAHLTTIGYTILHRNWRHSHYEIDIVALKDGLPHFVEVKTRSSKAFGWPEESVSRKKLKDLLKAADAFLQQHPTYPDFRIDVLSITIHPAHPPSFFLIEDVYG